MITRQNLTYLFKSHNLLLCRYLPDLECLFNLAVPEGKKIKLEFLGPIDVTVSLSAFARL